MLINIVLPCTVRLLGNMSADERAGLIPVEMRPSVGRPTIRLEPVGRDLLPFLLLYLQTDAARARPPLRNADCGVQLNSATAIT